MNDTRPFSLSTRMKYASVSGARRARYRERMRFLVALVVALIVLVRAIRLRTRA
ncbi:MAG TPA: hypothetical protein VNM90_15070 [Haliangium sp.]|nr:hypothetical protein [Haliangium sp.]